MNNEHPESPTKSPMDHPDIKLLLEQTRLLREQNALIMAENHQLKHLFETQLDKIKQEYKQHLKTQLDIQEQLKKQIADLKSELLFANETLAARKELDEDTTSNSEEETEMDTAVAEEPQDVKTAAKRKNSMSPTNERAKMPNTTQHPPDSYKTSQVDLTTQNQKTPAKPQNPPPQNKNQPDNSPDNNDNDKQKHTRHPSF